MTPHARDVSAARSVLVVGGSPERPAPGLVRRLAAQTSALFVCDGGADACAAAGVAPDVLVGDNDSISAGALRLTREACAAEVGFPMDKDSVDLRLAVRVAREMCPGLERLTFTGVSGGRPDHALAVFGVLARTAALAPVVEEDSFELHVLAPEGLATWTAPDGYLGRTLSVIAPMGPACVTERGMRWDVDHARLEALDDLGVSNVVERTGASVEVHEGVAFVIVLRERIEKRVTQA